MKAGFAGWKRSRRAGANSLTDVPSRRLFLRRSLQRGLFLSGICLQPQRLFADEPQPDGFMRASLFLTGRKHLDATYGMGLFQALRSADHRFEAELAALLGRIARSVPIEIDAFMDTLGSNDDGLAKIVLSIVSSWYLGTVGSGKAAVLVAYEQALMFSVSRGMTTIPTYCAEPNDWTSAPEMSAIGGASR